ncbi:hypothetical protein [Dyella sp.]|uniref:hypothetical protein n=1 Tax=Dyella sp. TaxID=1869338 RepID=UPI002ED24BAB
MKRKIHVVTLCVALMACMSLSNTHASEDISAANPSQQRDDPRITALIEKANRRVAQGESPGVVERWLTSAVEGLGVEKTPEPWDVYGQARWKKYKQDEH